MTKASPSTAAARAPQPAKAAKAAAKTAAKAPAKTPAKTPATTAAGGAPAQATAQAAGWSAAELKQVRAQLVTELTELQAAYKQSLADLDELQQHSNDGAGDDQADAGAFTYEREQEHSIAANRADLIAQVERAIERVDNGTYGFCERCGKPIPKARLQAFPAATLDVACKEREERR